MKEWNRESRELKLRYRERRATVDAEYNRKQMELNHDIEQLRNEKSIYIAKLKMQEDVDGSAGKLTAITERIRLYSLRKVDLDHERKLALIAIDREHAAELDALEAKYTVELDEQGKEVAV